MYSVVIVDDEPWALEDLAETVAWQACGFEITGCFTDSDQALAFIVRTKPDVVFTDVRMPVLSGIDLIEQAREKGVEAEFVIISSYEDFEAAKKAIHLQVCEYALKPYEKEELQLIVGMLENRLRQKGTRITISEEDKTEQIHTAALQIQKRCNPYLSYVLCVSKQEYQTSPDIADHICIPLLVKGMHSACIIASQQADAVKRKILQTAPHPFGVSRIHENITVSLRDMLEEALFSIHCDFQYSDKEIIGDIQVFLCRHLAEDLSLASIAKTFHFSEPYFCGLFKRGTGIPVIKFIQIIRVNFAAYLMTKGEGSLHEISKKAGFHNYSYFGKLFKQYKGITPEGYRLNLNMHAT